MPRHDPSLARDLGVWAPTAGGWPGGPRTPHTPLTGLVPEGQPVVLGRAGANGALAHGAGAHAGHPALSAGSTLLPCGAPARGALTGLLRGAARRRGRRSPLRGTPSGLYQEALLLRGSLSGALWTSARVLGHRQRTALTRPLCGAAYENEVHVLWDCLRCTPAWPP